MSAVCRSMLAIGSMLCSLTAGAALPPPATAPSEPVAPGATVVASIDDRADLEAFFDGVLHVGMSEHHVSGAVISIVKDGQVLFSKGYGYQDIEKRTPVDPRTTLFRIGSTSKLFTWTAVMQLVEAGKIDLDADVNQYLKGLQMPEAFGKPITMRHILTHTAGFEEGFLGYLVQDDPSLQVPIDTAMKIHMPARVRPPGEMSAYSNYGAALAGLIVEQVSGMPFNDYIAEHVYKPLDMSFSTMQEPVPERLLPHVATSYKQENGAPAVQKYEIIGGFRPAGSMASSALDMTHFMLAHLQDGRYEDRTILSPATAQRMHATAFQLDPRLPGMALGFYHSSLNGLDVIGHGGDTNFCHSDLLLIPSRQVGIFMSFYTEDNRVRDKVIEAFFDRYFPDAAARATATTKASADTASAVATAPKFAGRYQFTRRNYSKVEKALNLFTQMSLAPLPNGNIVFGGLGPEPWQFRPIGDNLYERIGGKQVLTFRTDASGQPTHLFMDFLPFMPAEVVPWYENATLWFTALGIAFLIFLATLLRAAFRWHEVKAMPQPERRTEMLAFVVAGWAVVTVGGLAGAVAGTGIDTILGSVPTSLKIALVLPLTFVALTVVMWIATVRAWRSGFWTTPRRVVFSLMPLAALVLSIYFWQWNMLGWQFG